MAEHNGDRIRMRVSEQTPVRMKAEPASRGITPEGTITISANGSYDVTNYAAAYIDVPGGDPDVALYVGLRLPADGTITATFRTKIWVTDKETPPEVPPTLNIDWRDGTAESVAWVKQTVSKLVYWNGTVKHSYRAGSYTARFSASAADSKTCHIQTMYTDDAGVGAGDYVVSVDGSSGQLGLPIIGKYKESAINLTEVHVGNNAVGGSCFSGCTALTTLTIGDEAEIEEYAFTGCTALGENLEIRGKSIKHSAFCDCTGVRKAWIRDTVETLGAYIFDSDSYVGKLPISMIYCEADSKPDGWNYQWNYGSDGDNPEFPVTWGQKTSPF